MNPRGPLPDLDSLRCFVEAARLLNFRAASRVVGLTPAALGQRIKSLEEQFGVRLFHRTTRRVELTEGGLSLLPQAQATLEAAWSCRPAARGDAGPVEQDVTIGTRHELGLSWLVPMLPLLRERHPGVTFHLYFGSGPDLELRVRTRQIDCAISSRRLTDPRVDGFRVHQEEYVLCAAPSLLEVEPLDSAEDAIRHHLVDIGPELPLSSYYRDALPDDARFRFAGVLHMGTIAAIRSAVLEGAGVAVMPLYLVRHDLDAGTLIRLLPHLEPDHDWFRLIHRGDDTRLSLLRALSATLASQPLA